MSILLTTNHVANIVGTRQSMTNDEWHTRVWLFVDILLNF